MKKILVALIFALFIYSCGGDKPSADSSASPAKSMVADEAPDDGKGIGVHTNVVLNDPLDETMAGSGKEIFDMKCAACHKLTANRVVGPGLKGVTERRTPEWIMNMVTNTETMLDKDPAAQKLLEECLTRMPNQNLSETDARNILEFLLSNDKG